MMSEKKPSWLPDVISVDGNWESVLKKLYLVFQQDFIDKQRYYDGREVWWDRRKLDGQYDEGFWHFISRKDYSTGDRFPDFRRAERLPWCGPTIDNSTASDVTSWDYEEGSRKVRTYLWLEKWDYVIVLEKKSMHSENIAFLVTAFYVSGDSTRKKLSRKYKQRMI